MYFVTLRLHDVKTLQCPLNTQWKYILLIYFTLLVKALFPSFHYSLGIYIYFFAIHFTKSKFTKFVMSLLKPRVSCSSNFGSLFRVIRENSCFQQKEPIKVQFFGLLNALMKVHPISHFTHLCWELSYTRTYSSSPCIKM